MLDAYTLSNVHHWLDTLRASRLSPGKSWLRHGNDYNVLGVACRLFLPDALLDVVRVVDGKPMYGQDGFTNNLPNQVRDLLGLRTNCGTYTYAISRGYMRSLYLDCVAGVSWKTIADHIESETTNKESILFRVPDDS